MFFNKCLTTTVEPNAYKICVSSLCKMSDPETFPAKPMTDSNSKELILVLDDITAAKFDCSLRDERMERVLVTEVVSNKKLYQ